jgi:ABC-type glycerol-3-phosphate transport system substrate-binding protein
MKINMNLLKNATVVLFAALILSACGSDLTECEKAKSDLRYKEDWFNWTEWGYSNAKRVSEMKKIEALRAKKEEKCRCN